MANYINEENKNTSRDSFLKAIDIGLDFKLREKVLNSASFEDLMNHFYEPLPEKGLNLDNLLCKVEKELVPYSLNFASPYAMAFPDAGNSTAGITADILISFLNQNLINWRPCSPVGTVIEMIVLNWFRQLIGFPCHSELKSPIDVGGFVTAGGVCSNTIALLLAREKAFPQTMKKGVRSYDDYSIIVPESIHHYSSRISAGWLGLGEENVVKAPVKDFKYDLSRLEKLIKHLIDVNKKPFFLVCYAGDSRSMTCDDFKSLHDICAAYDIWLHVDGCHGTQLIFSDKLKAKLKGIELSDSVTFDPHKTLNVPYPVSLLLVKNQRDLELIQRPEDIITGEKHSFGQITPFFGSRAFLSLKLYMLLKNLGVKGLKETIENRCEMARVLADEINRRDNFLLINPKIDINSVMFMYCPVLFREKLSKDKRLITVLNRVNQATQEKLLSTGEVWLHTFQIPDSSNILGHGRGTILTPLRFMSGNPILKKSHIDGLLEKVQKFGAAEMDRFYLDTEPKEKNKLATQDLPSGKRFVKDLSLRNNVGEIRDNVFLPWKEVCTRTTELILAVRKFCCIEFDAAKESFFVVIYGSYAYGLVKPSSDLDIVFFTDRYSIQRRDRIISFVKQLHVHYNMNLDNEVPYESKILIPYEFLIKACEGDGIFINGEWHIPKIEKTQECLTSARLLLRFFMGVMVNPCMIVAGNSEIYNAFRDLATKNLIRAVVYIRKRREISTVRLVKDFCVSDTGEFGDYYLGFSYTEPFISYLTQHLEQALFRMGFQVRSGSHGNTYIVDNIKKLEPEVLNSSFFNDHKQIEESV